MGKHIIAKTEEVKEGDRIVTQVEGREIGIFNLDGEYVAYTNWCPHQGGPCTEGKVSGTMDAIFDRDTLETSLEWTEDNILNCPWHGWEYELESGECISRQKVRLPSHEVTVQGEDIILEL